MQSPLQTTRLEGKTAKQKNPHARGTLARLSWVIGRLGGWDGYHGSGYKPAGPKTMATGLVRFDAIQEGWELEQLPVGVKYSWSAARTANLWFARAEVIVARKV